jgi:hypothetical protein
MHRWLSLGTVAIAAGLAVTSLLGPFVFDTIDYRFAETVRNQAVGLDAASLLIVAPVAVFSAWATYRANAAGPLVAQAVAAYAAYMLVQYVLGPNYTVATRVFPFQLALFVVSMVVGVAAWNAGPTVLAIPRPRRVALVMLAVAAFVVLRYVPVLVGSATEQTLPAEYAESPGFFWTIGLMDLGLFVPAAVATAVGLFRGAGWAAKSAYAISAWFLLVTLAVTAMGIAMVANNDPFASNGQVAMFVVLSGVVLAYSAWLFFPLLDIRWHRANGTPLEMRRHV